MIDGLAVVDAHMHVPRLSTVSPAWFHWAVDYGQDSGWRDVFGPDGDPVPARLEALLDAEGVDAALLFAEYSPRATGLQPVEDLLPVIAHHPARFHLVANVNPHLHQPPAAEAARQLDLGAVAVKVHPVHGGFRTDTPDMYEVYELCAERRVPVIVHTGPSIFPGSDPEAGDPMLIDPIAAAFPGVTFVLAHGGRGGTYEQAAQTRETQDDHQQSGHLQQALHHDDFPALLGRTGPRSACIAGPVESERERIGCPHDGRSDPIPARRASEGFIGPTLPARWAGLLAGRSSVWRFSFARSRGPGKGVAGAVSGQAGQVAEQACLVLVGEPGHGTS